MKGQGIDETLSPVVKIMELKMIKEKLLRAVELFNDGENAEAQAQLESLDISQIVECLDKCTFYGVNISKVTEYYNLQQCDECGYWHEADYMAYTGCDNMVCEDCLQNYYVWVESQDEYYHIDDCYQCQDCNKWYVNDSENMVEILDSNGDTVSYVCPDCAESNYYYWDSDDCFHDEEEAEAQYITDYHDDQREFKFSHINENGELVENNTADLNQLYMGFELEMYHKGYYNLADHDPLAQKLKSKLNVDCTKDGSLSEGFEVITNPMTLEAHIKVGTVDIPQIARDKGYRGHQGYGLHIHINKNYLNDMEQCALVYSVNRNWQDFLSFSLRTDNKWCKVNPDIELWGANKGYNDHSALINVGNTNTIEFRGFRNTTNRTHLIACLQLVECFVRLIKEQMECSMMNVKIKARQLSFKELAFELAIR